MSGSVVLFSFTLSLFIMKLHISKTFLSVCVFVVVSCSSSDPDPAPEMSAEEKQIEKLAKTWTLGTVRYGDEDISDRFENFALTLTEGKKYSATGSLGGFDYEPFKASGSWTFDSQDLNVINRNDGVVMDITVSEDNLSLVFTITEENGRRAGLGGYRFDLVTQ